MKKKEERQNPQRQNIMAVLLGGDKQLQLFNSLT